MEFHTTDLTSNSLYPIQFSTYSDRDHERFTSVDAHSKLPNPSFFIKFDSQANSYVITFTGVWSRINLPSNYFDHIRDEDVTLTIEERDALFEKNVRNKLQPIVDMIRAILDRVIPKPGYDFSAIAFWEMIRIMLAPSGSKNTDLLQDAFSLPPDQSEVWTLMPYVYFIGHLDNIGGEEVLVLPAQTPIYYENRVRLLAQTSFKVIRELENKQVAWFLDKNVHVKDAVLQMSTVTNDSRYVAYHADQTMDWPHAFIYRTAQSHLIGCAYNLFRNWKMLFDSQHNSRYTIKRLSYTYGGWYYYGRSILHAIMSTSPYPVDFSVNKYGNFKTIDLIVDTIINRSPTGLNIFHWRNMRKVFIKPLVSDFISANMDDSNYQIVIWRGVSTTLKGQHDGDADATDLTITTLPNPNYPLTEAVFPSAEKMLVTESEFSWVISITTFFSCYSKSIAVVDRPEFLPETGDFSEYRKGWNQFRALSKDAKVNGVFVNQNSLDKAFGDDWDKTLDSAKPFMFATELLKIIKAQPESDRVTWNSSTSKLISVIDGLFSNGVVPLPVDRVRPYELQFFGVITEPVQSLVKLMPRWFNVLSGIGAQAIHMNLRTDIANFLYNASPYIIISDIDQSEEVDEDEIASLIIRQLIVCLSFARGVVAYKIQYTTARILNLISRHLNNNFYTFGDVFLYKPCSSGVYSLESYLVFVKGSSNIISASKAKNWIDDRRVFLEPKHEDIGLYDVLSIRTIPELLESLSRNRHFFFCFRASNRVEYHNCLNAAMAISEQFKVYPIGNKSQYELLIVGSRWRKRSKLTERVGQLSIGTIPQGGDQYPLSGPSYSYPTPIRMFQGSFIQEAGMYNLAIKRRVSSILSSIPQFDMNDNHSVIDIGGRSCEGITFVPKHWRYAVMDPHHLPEYINKYNVEHIPRQTNWIDESPFDPFDIVIALFVLQVDGCSIAAQKDRINFLKRLAKKGKIVIFNYYSDERANVISRAKHRSITYGIGNTNGSFGDYEILPWLLDEDEEVLQGTIKVRVGIQDVLSAQMYFGTAINAELITWIDDFNDFCPVRAIVS